MKEKTDDVGFEPTKYLLNIFLFSKQTISTKLTQSSNYIFKSSNFEEPLCSNFDKVVVFE